MLLLLLQRIFSLISLAFLALGGYLVWSWWQMREAVDATGFDDDPQPWRLWVGVALLAWSFLGRTPVLMLLGRKGDDHDRLKRSSGEKLQTPTGAVLDVASEGPAEAPALVFLHGWGLERGIWWEARQRLSRRFRVVTYDLAGLGKSKQPADGKYSIERFADDLRAVVEQQAPRKVVLVGHSIGGMTVMTYCRRHADTLGGQVAGIVLENTTPVDPTHTTVLGEALHATEPVLRFFSRLGVPLQPLSWLMNWQSYLSGQTHIAMRIGGFGTRPTRSQLEQVSRAATVNSPAVQSKGNLAMMNWSIERELKGVHIPALVFIGGQDIVTVPSAGENIAWSLPRARRHPVQDAGHLGPMELADEYNSAIEAFADEVFTQGAQWADARPVDLGAPDPKVTRLPLRRPGDEQPDRGPGSL
ncbi:alpha/beta fold hydrolase [Phenylobacterium deserti]|uniref:AB hydrolase-1 domain-containing protein n=1 Tax=Phenylobacterium deserti TaxID=1914756 RepID=A0A328ATP9_9CAUL|nr:alpha/beta hydrolase [Phenylobacterium deserti]RAK57939.1 hypothetical protein DJ018_08535 [Phenylobacterium deserti]